MNKRIKELARQADEYAEPWRCSLGGQNYQRVRDTKFAELVRQDLYQEIGKGVITQINGAVLMEREACAKLCENVVSNEGYVQAKYCAETIRERGEK